MDCGVRMRSGEGLWLAHGQWGMSVTLAPSTQDNQDLVSATQSVGIQPGLHEIIKNQQSNTINQNQSQNPARAGETALYLRAQAALSEDQSSITCTHPVAHSHL